MTGKRPFVLCLTGSLGMGKSTTARLFAEAGVPVQDADAVVHELYQGAAVPAVEQAFPGTNVGGRIDRTKLSSMVLHDAAAMAKLEAIVHPLVAIARERFLQAAQEQAASVVLLDIPLLFEIGGDCLCDAVVVVSAPPDVQRARAFERPGMTEEKFAALLARQVPDEEKRRRSDFIVDSSQGLDHARRQVQDILRAVAKIPVRSC